MSVEVIKTFSTTCYGDVHEAIDNDVAIVPVLEQIVTSGGATVSFFFDVALSGPEDTTLDNLLAAWVCPVVLPLSSNGSPVSAELDTIDVSALTEDSYMIYDFSATAWDIVPLPIQASASSKLIQIAVGDILSSTGTTQIPKDSSVPLISEGTEIWTQAITPTVVSSALRINTNITASMSEKQEEIVFAVFRDSVCVGTVLQNIPRKKSGFTVSFSITDLPNTTSQVTYSVRVGRSSTDGVWYINNIHNTPNAFGGTLSSNGYSVEELEVI